MWMWMDVSGKAADVVHVICLVAAASHTAATLRHRCCRDDAYK